VDINGVVIAIEAMLRGYVGPDGRKALDVQVRPSGDDVDVIKIWVDIGGGEVEAWRKACEAELRKVPGATSYRLQVRVE
jgi:hypothetical protein